MAQFELSAFTHGVIRTPAFSPAGGGASRGQTRGAGDPFAMRLRAGSSLRLKNGCAQMTPDSAVAISKLSRYRHVVLIAPGPSLGDNLDSASKLGAGCLQVNLPNSITLTRICSIPLFMWVLASSHFSSLHGQKELLASALFIAASITDGIDGYLARKRGQITTMGILLDPLADKLLIAAAFVTLVQFNPHLVPAWIAVVIIGREFLVSGLRGIAASEGFTIEASDLGKLKMFVQIVSVVAVILDHRWQTWPIYGPYYLPIDIIARCAIWVMVGLSLISAADYFIGFWKKIDRHAVKRQRRAFILSRRKKQNVATI